MGKNLTGKDIIKLGFPQTNAVNIALGQISRFRKKEKKESVLVELSDVFNTPEKFAGHPIWGKVSESLIAPLELRRHELRTSRVPFELFGENEIDEKAKFQFYDSLKLPIAVQGALMPDAHYGYGLPIGGVLATVKCRYSLWRRCGYWLQNEFVRIRFASRVF